MDKFDKNETQLMDTSGKDPYYDDSAIYVHKESGLKFWVSYDQHILHETCAEMPKPSTMTVLKHVWVEAYYAGESCQYYVENIADLPALVSILQNTEGSEVALVASEDFINAGLLNL